MNEMALDKNHPINIGAFLSCFRWYLTQDGSLETIQRETGHRLSTNGIERMVDKATGYDRKAFEAYLNWFSKNIWGEDESPDLDQILVPEQEGGEDE